MSERPKSNAIITARPWRMHTPRKWPRMTVWPRDIWPPTKNASSPIDRFSDCQRVVVPSGLALSWQRESAPRISSIARAATATFL